MGSDTVKHGDDWANRAEGNAKLWDRIIDQLETDSRR